ncbi:UNVERIFIED_CONTAM: hypothetical protein NCL1_38026 [Trichonephila clavipes]
MKKALYCGTIEERTPRNGDIVHFTRQDEIFQRTGQLGILSGGEDNILSGSLRLCRNQPTTLTHERLHSTDSNVLGIEKVVENHRLCVCRTFGCTATPSIVNLTIYIAHLDPRLNGSL